MIYRSHVGRGTCNNHCHFHLFCVNTLQKEINGALWGKHCIIQTSAFNVDFLLSKNVGACAFSKSLMGAQMCGKGKAIPKFQSLAVLRFWWKVLVAWERWNIRAIYRPWPKHLARGRFNWISSHQVIPNQSVPAPVREFTVTTGGTQSTLQVLIKSNQ